MTSDSRHLRLDRIVGPCAEVLLAADLPELSSDRRAEVVDFVARRTLTVPSFTRFGITVIGLLFRGILALPGGRRAVPFIASRSLPVLGEYPRLIRSLGYAYVWEHWPDTLATGAST
jgi:hypothetical protein